MTRSKSADNIVVKAAGHGLYIAQANDTGVSLARISNSWGKWMLRAEARLSDADYKGTDVTHVIHNNAALVDAVKRQCSNGSARH